MNDPARQLAWILATTLAAGGSAPGEEPELPEVSFQGPEACAPCHPQHYQEWRGSAHAYSAVDPIFGACNKRALKDTGGKIGSLCIGCHVPVAARLGELGANFDVETASRIAKQGVSCEICHRMEPPLEGKPIANASFELTPGNVFHGRLHNPSPSSAHEMVTSDFIGKSAFCGTCHDVLHNGALLEKTYAQWSGSAHEERSDQCQDCHMLRYSGQAAVGGPFREELRRHDFPAASIPLVPFPNRGRQAEQVQEFLRTAARMAVIVPDAAQAGADFELGVRVKNSGAGHNLPTGLSNERQMWIEVTVLAADGRTIFRSGQLDENGDLMDGHNEKSSDRDPSLVTFSDRFIDERGKEVPFFWLAARVDERSLRPLEERTATYKVPVPASLEGTTLRARVRLLFRSFPPHALRDLALGHLAAELPIWEMDSFESAPLPVLRKIPRATEHRVPGDFPALQAAVDAAEDGDRILVAPGEYVLEASLDFRGKSIQIIGTARAERTTLRWKGASAEEGSVVVFRSGEGPEAKLEGFTLTGGTGTVAGGARKGGGVLILGSSPTIADCRIVSNGAADGFGGGICVDGGAPVLEGIEVSSSSAMRGGGVAIVHTAGDGLRVDRLRIRGNSAEEGGGIHIASGVRLLVERTEVAGNRARGAGGGLLVEDGAHIEIRRSTIVHNSAGTGAGALEARGGSLPRFHESILWFNSPPRPEAHFEWCFLEDGAEPGSTNQGGFPLFLDPTGLWDNDVWIGGEYRLLHGSPAIDAGDPAGAPDPDDSRAEVGAYFYEQPLKAFVRGDAGGDGVVALDDLFHILRYLALAEPLPCLDAADLNDDGKVDPADALWLVLFGLQGSIAPLPPFPSCGLDPTFGEGLSCDEKGEPCR
ncbi:MAG TPA: multiheme c-type cytochrome [Planctomycetota bacterium]|nr:multiheme c-type cytochrome [Planctomycetota bacterium]